MVADVVASELVKEGQLHRVRVGGKTLLLTRVDGKAVAVSNRCPHLGLPLNRGAVVDGAIRCPFHGSHFSLATGENLDWCTAFAGVSMPGWSHRLLALGRAPAPLEMFPTRETDGRISVELPDQ